MAIWSKFKSKSDDEDIYRKYVGIERGLHLANRKYITIDETELDMKRIIIEKIVHQLIELMRQESPTFDSLYDSTFGGGSAYEGLKIDKPDEYDLDILMRLPKCTKPVLLENNIPGYVNLKLENFHQLQHQDPEMYREMQMFVDDKNYLLTKEMKGSFMQSVFDRTVQKIPDNVVWVRRRPFKISRVQSLGPAFTLTIEGFDDFKISVDLVPCIVLDKKQWPGEGFESNPYTTPSDFFLVPKSPKRGMAHIERYWRLSFQKQEREIIYDRQWMKPTIRVLKRIRDHFGHKISSYAIKTMFMKELKSDNPTLDEEIPEMWLAPFSYCVVYMLESYAEYLDDGKIPYFWNKKLNLIEDLTPEQKFQYKNDIEDMLEDIKLNPRPETVLQYLR